MALSPWYVGQTLPIASLTFQDDGGNALNLTGGTLSVIIHSVSGAASDTAGAGTFNTTNAALGQATYTWAAADVATAGTYTLIFKVTYSGGVVICDPITWQVLAL